MTKGYIEQSEFGKRLRAARERRRLTTYELSERSGVARSQISRWENGYRHPRVEELSAIRRALPCSWEELLGPADIK